MNPLSHGDLHTIFKKLDRNGDGYVSISELHWLLDKVGIWTSPEELNITLEQDSFNLQEFISFYETITNTSKEEEEIEEQHDLDLLEAFKVFDLNNDGFISCEELETVLSRLGLWEEETTGPPDCRSMICKFDTNSDGLVDFQEFKAMMLLTSP